MHTDKGGKKQTAETQRVQRNAEEEAKLLMAKSFGRGLTQGREGAEGSTTNHTNTGFNEPAINHG